MTNLQVQQALPRDLIPAGFTDHILQLGQELQEAELQLTQSFERLQHDMKLQLQQSVKHSMQEDAQHWVQWLAAPRQALIPAANEAVRRQDGKDGTAQTWSVAHKNQQLTLSSIQYKGWKCTRTEGFGRWCRDWLVHVES